MSYLDGFIVPVPRGNREAYREMAAKAAPIFAEYGALQVMEAWGDDLPRGKTTDFFMSVKAEEGENVVFSWIIWPDKATRDAATNAGASVTDKDGNPAVSVPDPSVAVPVQLPDAELEVTAVDGVRVVAVGQEMQDRQQHQRYRLGEVEGRPHRGVVEDLVRFVEVGVDVGGHALR